MITMDQWTKPLAKHFQDPLLSAKALQSLRHEHMIRIIREEREILALAVLLPITPQDVILAGVWTSHEYDHMELAQNVVSQAISEAHQQGMTVLIPQTLLHYVQEKVLTPEEAKRPLESILEAMTLANIPHRHTLRNGGLKVVPATDLEVRHTEQRHSEL